MTDAQLTTAANTIKNETNAGSNTATRLGNMFLSLIDNKLNADKVVTTLGNTNDKIPTEKAVKDYVDANSGGGSSTVNTVKVSLTSAEILALNTTPKVLVAAPGVGKAIMPVSFFYKYNFISAVYNTNQTLALNWNGVNSANIQNTILSSSENITARQSASSTTMVGLAVLDYPIENKAFVAKVLNGNPTNGNGTLDIYITYTVIDL